MNMGADGWRWPIMILSWISAVSFLLLFFLLPE
jgi:predicted MFS family arabinose efflux permease